MQRESKRGEERRRIRDEGEKYDENKYRGGGNSYKRNIKQSHGEFFSKYEGGQE